MPKRITSQEFTTITVRVEDLALMLEALEDAGAYCKGVVSLYKQNNLEQHIDKYEQKMKKYKAFVRAVALVGK
jgi:hypothetical protein